jgi:hypothetical protein
MATKKTLIVATEDSAAGCLKASGIADRVIGVDFRLVTGPVPPISDPLAFFVERERLGRLEIPPQDDCGPGPRLDDDWRDVVQVVTDFDRVEVWVDPAPNSQLQLLHLLDWPSACPGVIEKLSLANTDFVIGDTAPERIVALGVRPQPVSDTQLQTARAAFRAFQRPTPEAWVALLGQDLQALPHLRATVDRMLAELPAVDTGLTFAETRLLEIVSTGPIAPQRAIAEYFRRTPLRVLGYWESGKRLHGLGQGEAPAILGLADGPFDLNLHDDRERFERYKQCKLSLSEFGQSLLKRQTDFPRHNTIARWWGGTRLTNDRLWRWDAVNRVLRPPA